MGVCSTSSSSSGSGRIIMPVLFSFYSFLEFLKSLSWARASDRRQVLFIVLTLLAGTDLEVLLVLF